MAKGFRLFALGPVVWRFVDAAEAKDPLAQSAWDRGVASVARALDNNRGAFSPILAMASGVVGFTVGVEGPPWLRALIGAAIGLALAWTVPTFWAALVAVTAPLTQRNEARQQLAAERERAAAELAVQRARVVAEERRIALIRDLTDLSEHARPLGHGAKLSDEEQNLRVWTARVQALIDAHPKLTATFPPFELPSEPFTSLEEIAAAYEERRQILEVMLGVRNGPLYRPL